MFIPIKSFAEKYFAGEVGIDDIDHHVEVWHKCGHENITLAEYLGLTEEEYEYWVEYSDSLKGLLDFRKAPSSSG